mgnify:CR=1 FL=1|jgi:hypothetical protein
MDDETTPDDFGLNFVPPNMDPDFSGLVRNFMLEEDKQKIELMKSLSNLYTSPFIELNLPNDSTYDTLQVLRSIEQNTDSLPIIKELIRLSNIKQDMLIKLFSDSLEIIKASNKEQAESTYNKIKASIEKYVSDAETIIKLTELAFTIYNFVITKF